MVSAEIYRVFYTVACCGNISMASTKLHVSQPAVSKTIKKLEYLTGCTLFFRGPKGVSLTTEGQILYDHVEKGFRYLESGERIVKKLAGKEAGIIKIGISTTLCKYVFMPYLKHFVDQYPGFKVSVVNRTSIETLKLLKNGQIDLCIISQPADKNGLACYDLMTVQDVFVVNPGKIDSDITMPLRSRHYNDQIMVLEEGNATRKYVDRFLSRVGFELDSVVEVSSMEFIIEFAKIGIGTGLVIKEFIKQELREGTLLEVARFPSIPVRDISLVHDLKIPLSNGAEAFIETVLD